MCTVRVTIFSTSFEFYVVTRSYSSHPFLRALNNSYSTGGQGFMGLVNKPQTRSVYCHKSLALCYNYKNVSICHVRVDPNMAGSESVIMSHNFIITRVSNNHHMCTN